MYNNLRYINTVGLQVGRGRSKVAPRDLQKKFPELEKLAIEAGWVPLLEDYNPKPWTTLKKLKIQGNCKLKSDLNTTPLDLGLGFARLVARCAYLEQLSLHLNVEPSAPRGFWEAPWDSTEVFSPLTQLKGLTKLILDCSGNNQNVIKANLLEEIFTQSPGLETFVFNAGQGESMIGGYGLGDFTSAIASYARNLRYLKIQAQESVPLSTVCVDSILRTLGDHLSRLEYLSLTYSMPETAVYSQNLQKFLEQNPQLQYLELDSGVNVEGLQKLQIPEGVQIYPLNALSLPAYNWDLD